MPTDATSAVNTSLTDWITAAEQSLPEHTRLDELARRTLDGPDIQPLYHERSPPQPVSPAPDSGDPQLPRNAGCDIDNRYRVRVGEPDVASGQIFDALQGGITSLDLAVGDTSSDAASVTSLGSLLSGVHLDMITLSVHGGEHPIQAADALFRCWHDRGVASDKACAELNTDPYALLARQGFLVQDMNAHLQSMADLVTQAEARYPELRCIGVDIVLHHEAGASVKAELTAGIATASAYMESLLDAGLEPDTGARQIVFQVAVDADFLMNIIKLRSLRRLWQHVLQHLGATDRTVRIVAVTSGRQLSTAEPWMNHLRHVSGAMAALLAGADTLMVLPHNRVEGRWLDEDHATGDRMARNAALILQEESRLGRVYDALAGAYAAEQLTDTLCSDVWDDLRELQSRGGLLQAMTNGWWQQRLAVLDAARQAALTDDKQVMVGVNRFRAPGEVVPSSPTGATFPGTARAAITQAVPENASLVIKPLRPGRLARAWEQGE